MARRRRTTAGATTSVEEMEVWVRTGYRPSRADDGMPPELRETWRRGAQEAASAAPAEDEDSRSHGDQLVRRYFDGQAEARRKRQSSGSKGGNNTAQQKRDEAAEIKGFIRGMEGIAHMDNRAIFTRVRAKFSYAQDKADSTLEKHYLRPVRRELGLIKRRRRAMPGRE